MNGLDMLDSFGELPEKIIENAAHPKKLPAWRRNILPAAAALLLCLGIGAAVAAANGLPSAEGKQAEATHEAEEPASPTELPGDEDHPAEMSYLGFIKREGRIYWYSYYTLDTSAMGAYIGSVKNKVAPGTPMEDWPDDCSYELLEYYELKGCDPEYVICNPYSGRLGVYVSREPSGAETAADVIEGMYHASEKYVSLTYESAESIDNGYAERFVLDDDCRGAALELIAALSEGKIIRRDESAYTSEESKNKLYGLTVSLGGLEMRINLMKGGYAAVRPLSGGYLLSYDEERAGELFALMKSGEHSVPDDTETSHFIRPEKLNEEPSFGRFFPAEAPEGFRIEDAYIMYPFDEDTGLRVPGPAESLSAEYRGVDDFGRIIHILVSRIESVDAVLEEIASTAPEYQSTAPIDEVGVDNIRGNVPDDTAELFTVSAYDEEKMITVRSNSLSPEEMIALLKECFGIAAP